MIRVLSCNLLYGRALPAPLLNLISQEAVDVLCAQELSPSLAAAIREVLPFGDIGRDGLRHDNGIASRRPVAMATIPMPRRDARVATLDPQDWQQLAQPLQVVNVHLAAPQLWPWFPNRLRRSEQLHALLRDRADASLPYAVIGDFNASPVWPLYRRMRRDHDDAALLNGARPSATWPSIPALGLGGLFRIDHCFLKGLTATRVRTLPLPGSDHSGLIVDLEETVVQPVPGGADAD